MSARPRRAAELLCAAAIGLALVGYFLGIQGTDRASGPGFPVGGARAPRPPGDVADAVSYAELRTLDIGPNRDFVSRLSTLDSTAAFGPGESPPDPARKREALAERAALRAYNGAPPVVPHVVDARSAASCLACHGEGLAVGDRVAARIPHEPYASCLQCHVEAASSSLPPFVLAESSFEGVDAPLEGARQYPGAPPVVPHTTWMRSDCLACHGPTGDFPMRTSHPERASCLQCHAPSAMLDQVKHAAYDGPRFWSETDEP